MKARMTIAGLWIHVAAVGTLCLLLAFMTMPQALAQTFTSSITGVVTDTTGAVIPGATVQIQNENTKDIHEQTSSASGAYNFQNLLPGTYQLTASASGFKSAIQTGLILRANVGATVDLKLQVGATSQRVVVAANSVLVDTQTPNNSTVIDSKMLQSLPVSTLNPLSFVFALAGTTQAQGGMTSNSGTFDQNFSAFGIDGGRSASADILIDGAPSTAIDWGGLMVSPIQSSVQEMQVVQNEYDAQFQHGGEGVVSLVTKGGSDSFHGEFYDYMRNDALDANTWSNTNAPPSEISRKPKFHRNQFGANLGGPIWRSKHLFFFGAYEGLRQPGSYGRQLYTVPTEAERNGDFSQALLDNGQPDIIYNPFTTHLVTTSSGTYYTRDPYPGNVIPSSQLNPVGQKLMALYPKPNIPGQGPNQINNFQATVPDNTENDKFDARVDWDQNQFHRMFVRVTDRIRENNVPGCAFCTGADNLAGNTDHGFQVVLNDTITPNSHWVINTYGAYTRWWEGQQAIGLGVANLSTIGLPTEYSQAPLLPLVYAGNFSQLGSSYSSFQRYIRYLMLGIVNVTHEWRNHTFKFGFNYDVNMINIRQDAPLNLDFAQDNTGCDSVSGGGPCRVNLGSSSSGNGMASMLVGFGSGGSSTFNMDPAMSLHSFGMYFGDNWRVTPRMTLYLGLRYSNQRPATERHNRVAYFDPKAVNSLSKAFGSTVRGAFEFAGVDGRGRGEWESDNTNFAPRFGVAYKLTPKLVGRVGGGLFYAPTSAMLGFDDGGQSPGYTAFTPWIATQNNAGYVPQNLVNAPFPNGLVKPVGNSLGDQTLLGIGAGQVWIKGPHPVGTLYQWSADLQYQLTNNSIWEIGYTGIRGRHLLYGNPNLDLDQLPTADLSYGQALNDQVPNPFYGIVTNPNSFLSGPTITRNLLMRPFPAFGFLQMTRSTPGATSSYNALNAKFEYRFANGLTSITTYRWSQTLDDGSEARLGWTGVDNWRDENNPKLDYSLSTRDVPNSLVEALVYQLPYGPGRQFGSSANRFLKTTLGGWNASTIIHVQTGLPLPNPVSFYNNFLSAYGFPGSGLPDLVGNPKPAHRTKTHWINPSAFEGSNAAGTANQNCGNPTDFGCQPFPFKYGNEPAHMTQLRERNDNNVDLSVSKNFNTERFQTQFRADFLNAFNHPIYGGSGNISTCINCGDLGTVYGTRNDPRNIQLSLTVTY